MAAAVCKIRLLSLPTPPHPKRQTPSNPTRATSDGFFPRVPLHHRWVQSMHESRSLKHHSFLTRQIPLSLRATGLTSQSPLSLAAMAFHAWTSRPIILFLIFFQSFPFASTAFKPTRATRLDLSRFREAPAFRNGVECSTVEWPAADRHAHHHPAVIHIAMTLDTFYLRGSVAAVLSVLQHASCPENIVFHFLASSSRLRRTITFTFPYLNFHLYHFDAGLVTGKISSSIRRALDQPLNYARMYLADLLPANVRRVIYLDSDLVVVDDAAKLWSIDLGPHVLGAPEYCHANFTNYFTHKFWADPALSRAFEGRRPCYFNTGVMVIDLGRWREGRCTEKLEGWMRIQKKVRIYELGSLPPFLLVFAGDVRGVGHRWNQHGLGGDNLEGLCRDLHPGPVSLLHWSGKGKPWLRLDSKRPCPLDALWAPYDLYRHASTSSLSFSDS